MEIHRQWGDNRWTFERERDRERSDGALNIILTPTSQKCLFQPSLYSCSHEVEGAQAKKWHAPLNCRKFACTVHWALQSDWTGSIWKKSCSDEPALLKQSRISENNVKNICFHLYCEITCCSSAAVRVQKVCNYLSNTICTLNKTSWVEKNPSLNC